MFSPSWPLTLTSWEWQWVDGDLSSSLRHPPASVIDYTVTCSIPTDDVFCFQPWREKGLVWGVALFVYLQISPIFYGVKLFKHCRLDCCNLLENQKHTSFSLCQMKMNDEAGEEERELRHQGWHCEYLMVFVGTVTDQTQKLERGW